MYKCKYCGKEFEISQHLGGHVLAVHKKENHAGKRILKENEEKYLKNPKMCECCGTIIPYEMVRRDKSIRFCSRSCSAKVNNEKREKKLKEKRFCPNCGKELVEKTKATKFCCQKCSIEYRKKKYIKDWFKNGKLLIIDGGAPRKTIREYILREQNSRCAICGMENIWNGKPLNFVLDHIDGNSSNSSRENLHLICHNCDSQTETYKSKNKGNGRFFRRQRMLDGKSF